MPGEPSPGESVLGASVLGDSALDEASSLAATRGRFDLAVKSGLEKSTIFNNLSMIFDTNVLS